MICVGRSHDCSFFERTDAAMHLMHYSLLNLLKKLKLKALHVQKDMSVVGSALNHCVWFATVPGSIFYK
jgi:hypothetical protein